MQTAHPLPDLFGNLEGDDPVYQPRPAPLFRPHRIILTKGCATTPERRAFIERICAVYPRAEVIEQFDTSHNKIRLGESDPLALHYEGRRTLVFGIHQSALGRSTEETNTCPNFWPFSPYGYGPYGFPD